jgi:serine protease Do
MIQRGTFGWLLTALTVGAIFGSALTPDLLPAPFAASQATLDSPPPVARTATPGTVRAVAERVRPAVVQITNEQVVLDQVGDPAVIPAGVGSGVIYSASGLILTNNHVIASARSLTVSLPDGRVYPGKLLGGDQKMDLAVVKIEPQPGESLPVAPLGVSARLAVGDEVVAIGNALGLPGGPTVTAGVVSAVGRAIQEPSERAGEPGPYLYDLIQTDAAINPGNSGGPLLNMVGEVIGINTLAVGSDGNWPAQGISFAIAIDAARPIAEQLVRDGRVSHPFLGVAYALVTPALAAQFQLPVTQGLMITQVMRGGPAATAGIRPRDIIVAVDDQPIVDETTLGRALNQRQPGERVQLHIARGTRQMTVEVRLSMRPD